MTYRIVHYIKPILPNRRKRRIQTGTQGRVRRARGCRSKNYSAEDKVVGTVICGDGLFTRRAYRSGIRNECLEMIKGLQPDMPLCRPAFNAGRYGFACRGIKLTVGGSSTFHSHRYNVSKENRVELYSEKTFIAITSDSARSHGKSHSHNMVGIRTAAQGREDGASKAASYPPRHKGKSFFHEKSGTVIEMLLAKLKGESSNCRVRDAGLQQDTACGSCWVSRPQP